jgi:putative glutamine amidotransferase
MTTIMITPKREGDRMPKQDTPIVAVVYDWGSVSSIMRENGAHVVTVDNINTLNDVLPYVDGILLTGGGDVEPSRYGAERHRMVYGVDQKRDKMELHAVRHAMNRRIPVMGICRGLQIINVAYGGTLQQNLDDHGSFVTGHEGSMHDVVLSRKSRVGRVLGTNIMRGTSLHHQAIENLGDGLVAVGWAKDGVIEMIESAPHVRPYVLATQFHPEMDQYTHPEADLIFEHFTNVVRTKAHGRGDRWDMVMGHAYKSRYETGNARIQHVHESWWDGSEGHGGHEGYHEQRWDDPYSEEYNEWWSMNQQAALEVRDEVLAAAAGNVIAKISEVDSRCEFPPCKAPSDCSRYNDCAAKVVATIQGQRKLDDAKMIEDLKRGNPGRELI